jgi:hypothetical protein
MHRFAIPFAAGLALLALSACNPVPPLGTADKAKYVFELIEQDHSCDGYRQRLDVPAIEMPAIDAVYRDAVKSGCIKRDV